MFDTSIEVKEGNLATQASNMLQVFFTILMSMFSTSASKGGELTTQAPNIFITIFRRSIIAWYDCFVKLNLVFCYYVHSQHRIKKQHPRIPVGVVSLFFWLFCGRLLFLCRGLLSSSTAGFCIF